MRKSNATKQKETGKLFMWRLPKNNHDRMVQFGKQVYLMFRIHGTQSQEVFQLNDSESTEEIEFTNFADTVNASKNEELWLELHSYRDRKQRNDVSASISIGNSNSKVTK